MAFWSENELHVSHHDMLWEIPLATLLLFMRQKLFSEGIPGVTLEEKQWIDEGGFDNAMKTMKRL